MAKKDRFYVHKYEGKVTRIAKLGDDGAYGWVNGKWELMPGLWKIENDVTADYEPISKEEADALTAGMVKE